MKRIEDIVDKIHCADCLPFMADMPDNSVDSIITDIPYGIGFMGREWDTFTKARATNKDGFYITKDTDGREMRHRCGWSKASAAGLYDHSRNAEYQQWCYQWTKEALRVAKPGAMALVFGGTRTSHRLVCAMEDAGWQIRDTMMWMYGSGFPKSKDISKEFDKRASLEQLTEKLGRKPTSKEFKKAWEGFREVVGKKYEGMGCKRKNTLVYGDYDAPANLSGLPLTAPVTDLAKQWDGWGTALKPGWEPIVVAMKPIEGTFAATAAKWGVAGLWIDGGRIEAKDGVPKFTKRSENNQNCYSPGLSGSNRTGEIDVTTGRWPANVILDEESAAMLDDQSGAKMHGAGHARPRTPGGKYDGSTGIGFGGIGVGEKGYRFGDSGGASRFFYCAKASKSERESGLIGHVKCISCGEIGTERHITHGRDIYSINEAGKDSVPNIEVIVAEWHRYNRNGRKGKQPEWSIGKCARNHHPTVKPLALMEYLCNLTKTPTGGIVLDPFGGSGTTAMACVKTGRQYIVIEKDPEYCEIAGLRTQAVRDLEKEKMGLFG